MAVVGLFPLTPLFSAAVLIQRVLRWGARDTLIVAGIAFAALAVISPLLGEDAQELLSFAAGVFAVAVFTGAMLGRLRSVTLAVQAALLIGLAVIVVLHVGTESPQMFWRGELANLQKSFEAVGIENTELVIAMIGPLMHEMLVSISWFAMMLAMLLGYSLYSLLPEGGVQMGRFRDLNLGRLIAAIMVAVCVLLGLTEVRVAQGLAFLLMLAFLMQGFALLHWLVAEKGLPVIVLIMAYATILIPGLGWITLVGLSLGGYIDSWVNLRRQLATKAG